jgi:hypothetical protein
MTVDSPSVAFADTAVSEFLEDGGETTADEAGCGDKFASGSLSCNNLLCTGATGCVAETVLLT